METEVVEVDVPFFIFQNMDSLFSIVEFYRLTNTSSETSTHKADHFSFWLLYMCIDPPLRPISLTLNRKPHSRPSTTSHLPPTQLDHGNSTPPPRCAHFILISPSQSILPFLLTDQPRTHRQMHQFPHLGGDERREGIRRHAAWLRRLRQHGAGGCN